ncbi:PRD domain-containing protein [Irregularibacter muris]|uniref:PRD domain-containing protein n=2 Tax=Irregularibacter muris TaxID=1796619 RepID=A0AAE3HFG1_9FIRM|nr:PRD domain-containing protein [Irregularibacter muris]
MSIKRDYMISKVLNNNVILAVDKKTRQEHILVGKGIGFGKKDGKMVRLSNHDIEKSFIAYDKRTKKEYLQLLNQLDGKIIGMSEEIISLAEKELGHLNSHIHIVLTDHIAFAIERIHMQLEISNPFLYEIKALYPEEFQIGLKAAQLIKERLEVDIPEAEIGFIALHLHSARQNKKVKDTMKDTRLLKEVVDLVQKEIAMTIDNQDLMYTRLINHLRVAIIRTEEKKPIDNPLLESIKEQFEVSYRIAQKVGEYINEKKNIDVKEGEIGYLALHIERIRRSSN